VVTTPTLGDWVAAVVGLVADNIVGGILGPFADKLGLLPKAMLSSLYRVLPDILKWMLGPTWGPIVVNFILGPLGPIIQSGDPIGKAKKAVQEAVDRAVDRQADQIFAD
jgi:hypothetical protein